MKLTAAQLATQRALVAASLQYAPASTYAPKGQS